MIHVCFGLHDKTGRYSKFTGTAILSLFENSSTPPSTCVHILHDNTLTQDNREKFIYIAGRYNQLVKFYNVEELCADKIEEMLRLVPSARSSVFSVAMLYRLLIAQVLPPDIEKIIYLDSDIVVNLDINELWRIELQSKILAAVSEKKCGTDMNGLFLCKSGLIKHEEYFNSGVMILELKQWRANEKRIMEGTKFCAEHPQCFCIDQDILNYAFAKRSLKLPPDFNVFVVHARRRKEPFGRKIYHYAGKVESFTLGIRDDFYRLWMSYFIKTPFFDEETFGRLFDGFQQIHVELKNSMVKLSALMSGKTRAFFTLPHNVEATKEIFAVRDDEDIILAESQESLQKLIDAMKLSRGKKIFFIMLPNFPFNALTQAGFVYGKDFLNGLEFLSAEHGVPLNSYQLVQAM